MAMLVDVCWWSERLRVHRYGVGADRALRDAYRDEVEGKASDSSDEDDDEEDEEKGKKGGNAGGAAEKKEQEKQLPAFDHGGYATVMKAILPCRSGHAGSALHHGMLK